jgi:hypothetical protein
MIGQTVSSKLQVDEYPALAVPILTVLLTCPQRTLKTQHSIKHYAYCSYPNMIHCHHSLRMQISSLCMHISSSTAASRSLSGRTVPAQCPGILPCRQAHQVGQNSQCCQAQQQGSLSQTAGTEGMHFSGEKANKCTLRTKPAYGQQGMLPNNFPVPSRHLCRHAHTAHAGNTLACCA